MMWQFFVSSASLTTITKTAATPIIQFFGFVFWLFRYFLLVVNIFFCIVTITHISFSICCLWIGNFLCDYQMQSISRRTSKHTSKQNKNQHHRSTVTSKNNNWNTSDSWAKKKNKTDKPKKKPDKEKKIKATVVK